jgi:hypothetical protein
VRRALLFFLLLAPVLAAAEPAARQLPRVPPLLRDALHRLYLDNAALAFTRTTATTVEQFDPSLPEESQWLLVRVGGRAPTPAELDEWRRRQARGAARPALSLADFLDLDHARVQEVAAGHTDFFVGLKNERLRAAGLYALLTVDDATGALTRFEILNRRGWVEAPLDATTLLLDGSAVPPPALVRLVGATAVEWKGTRWADYRRVKPYNTHAEVIIGELRGLEN